MQLDSGLALPNSAQARMKTEPESGTHRAAKSAARKGTRKEGGGRGRPRRATYLQRPPSKPGDAHERTRKDNPITSANDPRTRRSRPGRAQKRARRDHPSTERTLTAKSQFQACQRGETPRTGGEPEHGTQLDREIALLSQAARMNARGKRAPDCGREFDSEIGRPSLAARTSAREKKTRAQTQLDREIAVLSLAARKSTRGRSTRARNATQPRHRPSKPGSAEGTARGGRARARNAT